MKKLASVSLTAILLFTFLPCMTLADNLKMKPLSVFPAMAEYVPGEFIVKFKDNISQKAIAGIHAKIGSKVIYASPYAGFQRVKIPIGLNEMETLRVFKKNAAVKYAQPNYICRAHFSPNDPLYPYQWHFTLINMENAWEIQSCGSSGVILAILDSGIAYEDYDEFINLPGKWWDHWNYYSQAPDLEGTIFVQGYDFINDDTHPNDDYGHGTHVTGTAAQKTDNDYGVAGMADGTSIMPVKVLDQDGLGTAASLADGLYYAANNGADIINMSLGWPPIVTPEDIQGVTDAVAYASGKGVIMVASSGNDGGGVVSLPAAYPDVIAVAAVHSGDELADYSQYGDALEVVAPGGDGEDRDVDGYIDGVLQETFDKASAPDYGNFSLWFYTGTSMAAPHVSGLVALLMAQDGSRTLADIREILHNTSIDRGDPGWDTEYGYGRIDAYAALLFTPQTPVAAFSGTPTSGDAPLPVQFTDLSTGSIDTWAWDFGDSDTSDEENPSHIYENAGTYTVSLDVSGPGGSDSVTMTDYITVTEAPANTMHVDNIDMEFSIRTAGKNIFRKALATIKIVDSSGNPLEGATVNASWSGATSDSDSGITGAGGTTTMASDEVKNASSGTTFTIEVNGIVKPGWTYEPSDNNETIDSIIVP